MLIPVLLFIVGLLCLIKGGDWFVDGASALARRFHLPELLIGGPVCGRGLHHRLLQPPHRHCAAGNVRGVHGLQCAGYEKRPRPGRR